MPNAPDAGDAAQQELDNLAANPPADTWDTSAVSDSTPPDPATSVPADGGQWKLTPDEHQQLIDAGVLPPALPRPSSPAAQAMAKELGPLNALPAVDWNAPAAAQAQASAPSPAAQAAEAAVKDLNALPPTNWNAPAPAMTQALPLPTPDAVPLVPSTPARAVTAVDADAEAAAIAEAKKAQEDATKEDATNQQKTEDEKKVQKLKDEYGLNDKDLDLDGLTNPSSPAKKYALTPEEHQQLIDAGVAPPVLPQSSNSLPTSGAPVVLAPETPGTSPQQAAAASPAPIPGAQNVTGVSTNTASIPSSPEAVPLVPAPAPAPAPTTTETSSGQAAPAGILGSPGYKAAMDRISNGTAQPTDYLVASLAQGEAAIEKQRGLSTQEAQETKVNLEAQAAQLAAIQKQQQQEHAWATAYAQHAAYEQDGAMKKYFSEHLDPQHYWNTMSTGGKIATSIGLIMGSLGGYATGGQNFAAKAVSDAIDKDIDMQKFEILKDKDAANAWGDMVHTGIALGQNADQAATFATLALKTQGEMQAQQIIAKYGGTQAQIDAWKNTSQLYNGVVELQNKMNQFNMDMAVKRLTMDKMRNDSIAAHNAAVQENTKRGLQGLSPLPVPPLPADIGPAPGQGPAPASANAGSQGSGAPAPTSQRGQGPRGAVQNALKTNKQSSISSAPLDPTKDYEPGDIRNDPQKASKSLITLQGAGGVSRDYPGFPGVKPVAMSAESRKAVDDVMPAYADLLDVLRQARDIKIKHPNAFTGDVAQQLSTLQRRAVGDLTAINNSKLSARNIDIYNDIVKSMAAPRLLPPQWGGVKGNPVKDLENIIQMTAADTERAPLEFGTEPTKSLVKWINRVQDFTTPYESILENRQSSGFPTPSPKPKTSSHNPWK
jgi:hypothetical protein